MINLVGARSTAKGSLLIATSGFYLCFLISILVPTSRRESTTLTSLLPRSMLTLSIGLYSHPPILSMFLLSDQCLLVWGPDILEGSQRALHSSLVH
jgi:hypothetical protein